MGNESKSLKVARAAVIGAEVRVGRDWYGLDVDDLVDETATFLEGADQCDVCGYSLDGTDEGPSGLQVCVSVAPMYSRLPDGSVAKDRPVLAARLICRCGHSYPVRFTTAPRPGA